MKLISKILSTSFFIGYIPFASGTFGSLFGLLSYIFLFRFTGKFYLLITVMIFYLGKWVSNIAEKEIFKIKDPKEIVIDEVVGILISFSFFNFNDRYVVIRIIMVFLLFRIFDILKPYPIKNVQKLSGGTGIMLDDAIAGIYTLISYQTILFFIK